MNYSSKLPETLKNILKKNRIPESNVSISIFDLNQNQQVINHNADVMRTPASVMKIVTTYAGLKHLSGNFQWQTEIFARGEIDNGTLGGDLVIKGYGNPFLVEEHFWQLLNEVKQKGIDSITGNLVIDNSFFGNVQHDAASFDNKPYRVYNAMPSATMYNFQASKLILSYDEKRKKVKLDVFPKNSSVRLRNRIEVSRKSCRKSHLRPKLKKVNNELQVSGHYSPKCGQQSVLRAVSSPEIHLYDAFRTFWKSLGGHFDGTYEKGIVRSGDTIIHTDGSPTLREQISLMNKWSNNVMTRQLFLTLGSKVFGAPSSYEKSEKAVIDILSNSGIQTSGIKIDNGSGLSRTSKLSAQQIQQLLQVAYQEALMPEFISSLSLSGIDGTMSKRFIKNKIRGQGHFKTGTINNVSAIAGYLLTESKKRLAIVVILNGKRISSSVGRKIQNEVIRWSHLL